MKTGSYRATGDGDERLVREECGVGSGRANFMQCRIPLPTTRSLFRQFRQPLFANPQIPRLFNETAARSFGMSIALTRVSMNYSTAKKQTREESTYVI